MLKVLFEDISGGRLARLPFLGYWLLFAAAFLAIGIGLGAAVGVAEQRVGGDLQSAQDKLRETLGIPAVLIVGIVFAILLFIGANLKAKRIRDIGLPGWWTLLGIVALGLILSQTVSQQAAQGFSSLVLLALLLIPANAFGGKTTPLA